MLIQSQSTFKSIGPIEPAIKLPDFVVLSGLNGAGKSQLLEALKENKIQLLDDQRQPLRPAPKPNSSKATKFLTHDSFSPSDGVIASHGVVRQPVEQLVGSYRQYQANRAAPVQVAELLKRIAQSAEKEIYSLTPDDITRNYPLEDDFNQRDIFSQNFSILFKRYESRRYDNDVAQFRNTKDSRIPYLTDEEFRRKFGDPPWVLVNSILAEAGLDYHVTTPEGQLPDTPFELKLISTLGGAEINFSDLSGGEKVIMSLALSLYNSRFDVVFPKVLLMDEPDAHLHPSMTRQFLNVIQNVFVRDKGVKVIMTTHSPSTVALSPDAALFIMNRRAPRIEKATKDRALSVLTSGVPTLSVDYENRRTVFVESRYDASFFEIVYQKLKAILVPEISISFISSGISGSGNCNQVKEIVNALVAFGNRSIYGIVD